MKITANQVNALAELLEQAEGLKNNDLPTLEDMAIYLLLHGVVVLPCKLGDSVWAIRSYKGNKKAMKGTVTDMCFVSGTTLSVAVGGVCRGEWGVKVFATREECERAIKDKGVFTYA